MSETIRGLTETMRFPSRRRPATEAELLEQELRLRRQRAFLTGSPDAVPSDQVSEIIKVMLERQREPD